MRRVSADARSGMMASAGSAHGCEGYSHEAFFYASPDEFVDGMLDFIRGATSRDEPIFAVLSHEKIEALRSELGADAEKVLFADMSDVGPNPARIIPAWDEFVDSQSAPGLRLWGIGEPIWAGRSDAELAECQRHEALLNVVFADADFTLLCPYDTSTLSAAVIDRARRNHPTVHEQGVSGQSEHFPGAQALAMPSDEALTDPPPDATLLDFHAGVFREVRAFVAGHASRAGLTPQRAADLAMAVHELVANSVRHGGGRGSLQTWRERGTVLCEVRDLGRIDDPLADRRRPTKDAAASRGLWLTNQLCDLVQIRSFPTGSAVRLHMRLADGVG